MSQQFRRLAEPAIETMFDEGHVLIEAAQRAFSRAAKEAVAENDRLGVITHGSKDGKMIVRQLKPVFKTANV